MKESPRSKGRSYLLAGCRRPCVGGLQVLALLLWILQPALTISRADQATSNGYTLTVWAGQPSVNAGDPVAIYALLTDAASNAVPGALVYFTAVAGDGSTQGSYGYTDGAGQCAMGYTAGTSSSQVTVFDGQGYGLSTSCQINVSAPPAFQMWIGADKNPLQAGENTTVRVLLAASATGVPLANTPVYFQVQSGDAFLGALSAVTDAGGQCSVPVACGSCPSQIMATGAGASNTFALLCPVAGDLCTLGVTTDQNPVPPNGTTTVRATCTDAALGLLMPGRTLSFTCGAGTFQGAWGASSSVSLTTDAGGACAVTYQGSTLADVIQVTDVATGFSQPLTVGVQSPSYQVTLSAAQTALQAGQGTTLTATLADANSGLPVNGATLMFQVTGGDGSLPGGSMWSMMTDASGTAQTSFTAGLYNSTVAVTDTTFSSSSQSLVIATLSSAPPDAPGSGADSFAVTFSANDGALAPGGTTMLHVTLTDTTTNQPAGGAIITLQNLSGDGTFAGGMGTAYATTDGNGSLDLAFTGGLLPTCLTATAGGYSGASASLTIAVQTVVPDTYALTVSAAQPVLSPSTETTLSAQLMDTTTGQPVAGVPLAFQVTGGDGLLTGAGSGSAVLSLLTDGAGMATAAFTGGAVESTVQVTDSTVSGASQATVIGVLAPKDAGTLTLWADDNIVAAGAPPSPPAPPALGKSSRPRR